MTVIATMIAKSGTAHATDSLLTTRGPGGTAVPVETQETKVVPAPRYYGVLAFWGYAGDAKGERTIDWLRERVTESTQFGTAEDFARAVAQQLQAWLVSKGVSRDARYGIGVHFSAYERIGDYWVPELFLISNFEDYSSLRSSGVGYSRETYGTITGIPRSPEDRESDRRMRVHEFLAEGNWLRYNNGDPMLFNTTADAVRLMLDVARVRGALADLDVEHLRRWTRLPVETVATLQRDFYRPEVRIVGGKIHDLAVTPTGEYSSTSGDEP
jgi:hypothetical protein